MRGGFANVVENVDFWMVIDSVNTDNSFSTQLERAYQETAMKITFGLFESVSELFLELRFRVARIVSDWEERESALKIVFINALKRDKIELAIQITKELTELATLEFCRKMLAEYFSQNTLMGRPAEANKVIRISGPSADEIGKALRRPSIQQSRTETERLVEHLERVCERVR